VLFEELFIMYIFYFFPFLSCLFLFQKPAYMFKLSKNRRKSFIFYVVLAVLFFSLSPWNFLIDKKID